MQSVNKEDVKLLQEVQTELFMKFLPLIVILIILGLVGFLGNLLAIIFYFTKTKRTSTVLLIGCLAIADLIVCVLIIPNIIEMAVNVLYTEDIPCKIAHCAGLMTILVSGFTLVTIAIDRHRKICAPLGKQLDLYHAKRIVFGIGTFSFCLAFRDFFTFDAVPVEINPNEGNKTVTGFYCTTQDKEHLSLTIFNAIDFSIVVIAWLTLIVSYTHIVITLYKVMKKKNTHRKNKPSGLLNAASSADSGELTKETQLPSVAIRYEKESRTKTVPETVALDQHSIDHDVRSDTEIELIEKTTKTQGKPVPAKRTNVMSTVEKDLSIMMCVVSVVFICCFTPYFVIKILMRAVFQTGEEYELDLGVQFAIRFPYLNSVFNPIIYCYFNPHFRNYVKGLITNLFWVCPCRRFHI